MRPAANQLLVSATQKSGSLCVIMAWVSVIITFLSVEYVLLCAVKCAINSELSFIYSSGMVSGVGSDSSKFISVNVGTASMSGVGGSISKSVGNGNDVSSISGMFDVSGVGVWCGVLNADVWMRPILLRARMNATRNSAGMSGGNSVGVSTSSGPNVGFSDSGWGIGAGSVDADFKKVGILILGTGIVISGCLVRTISVVVATYSGNAARINMPKTKPGNPRN